MRTKEIILFILIIVAAGFTLWLTQWYNYKQNYMENHTAFLDWQMIGGAIDLSAFLLCMVLFMQVFYMLGKYQAFDKNPQFNRAWWIMHYKLRGGEEEDV